MDWKKRYADKLTTAPDAIRSLSPGRRFFIGSGAAEPRKLTAALITHGDHFADNEIVHLLTLGEAPYVQPGMEKRFRHTALFIGKNVREAVQAGRADFMPVFLSEIPKLIRTRRVGVTAHRRGRIWPASRRSGAQGACGPRAAASSPRRGRDDHRTAVRERLGIFAPRRYRRPPR